MNEVAVFMHVYWQRVDTLSICHCCDIISRPISDIKCFIFCQM